MSLKCNVDRTCENLAVREVEYEANGITYTKTMCDKHLKAFESVYQTSGWTVSYEGAVRDPRAQRGPNVDATIPPPPGSPEAAAIRSAPAPGQPDRVFVIIERDCECAHCKTKDTKLYVTRDQRWAKRWAKWNPKGDYRECQVEQLPGDEDEEKAEKPVALTPDHEA